MPVPNLKFGEAWAAAGETRPSRYLTPLAWVDGGHAGGVVFMQLGTNREQRHWTLLTEWDDWVQANNAAPVVVEPEGELL